MFFFYLPMSLTRSWRCNELPDSNADDRLYRDFMLLVSASRLRIYVAKELINASELDIGIGIETAAEDGMS